jgi:uncharacterized protein (DUF433 family)
MNSTADPLVQRTPGVCGGDACIRKTRIPVWLLVLARKQVRTDDQLLADCPVLTLSDLDAGWGYYRANAVEIERAIGFNDTAANVPDGELSLAWVIIAGSPLGITDEEMGGAVTNCF